MLSDDQNIDKSLGAASSQENSISPINTPVVRVPIPVVDDPDNNSGHDSDEFDPKQLNITPKAENFDKSINEVYASEYASGGNFKKSAAERAIQLISFYWQSKQLDDILSPRFKTQQEALEAKICAKEFYKLESESQTYIADERHLTNMYLILSGLALINEREEVYTLCATKLGSMSLGTYNKALVRTDQKIRNLLNLTLQAAIVMCNSEVASQVLIWGRQNTLNLQVNEYWLIIALQITQDVTDATTSTKQGQGDRKLLQALLSHRIVVKPQTMLQETKKQGIDTMIETVTRVKNLDQRTTKFAIDEPNIGGSKLMNVLKKSTTLQFTSKKTYQGSLETSLDLRTAEPHQEDHRDDSKRQTESRLTVKPADISLKIIVETEEKEKLSLDGESSYQIDTSRDLVNGDTLNASWCTTTLQNRPARAKSFVLSGSKKNEKYLRLVLLVRLQIDRIKSNKSSLQELVKVIWSCATIVDSLDLERCVSYLYNENKIDVIFAVLQMLEDDDDQQQEVKSELAMLIFEEGLTRQQIHICLRIMHSQEDVLLRNDNRVLRPLLQSLIDSPFYIDNKLAMVKRFLPKIQFRHVGILVTNLQKLVRDSDQTHGIFVCNINPFIVATTILYICDRIKTDYPLAQLRILGFEGLLMDRMILLLNNVYDPYKVSLLLKQTDIENYSTLDLMSRLKMYRAMQTSVAYRVIQDTWVSRVDVSGSFLENSTAYDYLKFGNVNSNIDFEQKKRFYHSRDLKRDVRPHHYAYRVWLESMKLRYFFEMVFFFVCVILFQRFISAFNTDMHKLMDDVEILIERGVFDRDASGRVLIRESEPTLRQLSSTMSTEADTSEDKSNMSIEQVKEHLAHEIELAVFELDEAMFVAMISFSFPFQLLMSYIYSIYTKRNFRIRFTSIIDLIIFACVFLWFEKFEVYIHDDNPGFGLTDPPHEYHRFMQRMLNDNTSGDFHFDWLLAGVAFLFWIRLVIMLELTSMFGPLIRTTVAMMKDLVVFFAIWVIQLIAFSCVAMLCFGGIKEYDNLHNALLIFFLSALGEWDFSIYDQLGEGKKYVGIVFHLIVISANLLVLLNLVIAIMSDTYAVFAEVKLGLYLQGIIQAIPSYKNNKSYGGLIVMTPPLNLIAFLLLPFYHFIEDKKKLRNFNSVVCKIVYLPLAIMITFYFEACSLILTPFAWLKVMVQKCKLAKRIGKGSHYTNAMIYFIVGVPVLVLTSFVDCYWFFKHLYQWQMVEAEENNDYPKVSLKAFNRFYHTVRQKEGQTCNAKQLVLELRDQYRTDECIFAVLYANTTDIVESQGNFTDKKVGLDLLAVRNGKTQQASMILSKIQKTNIMEGIDYNLRGINTFNLFKRVVWSCVTDRPNGDKLDGTSLVNLPLLKGLLNEIHAEIYVSNLMQQQEDDSTDTGKKIDISAYEGFDDYKEVNDNVEISKQVAQVVLIDPMAIIKAVSSYEAVTGYQPQEQEPQNQGVEKLDNPMKLAGKVSQKRLSQLRRGTTLNARSFV